MATKVEKSILVNVPVSTAYNQWTQFEDFPQFMSGITSVETLGEDRLRWHAEIAGVKRQWAARVLEQIPDRKIAWAATEGATNAGSIVFEDMGGGQTSLTLNLEYEPEGLIEKAGDKLNIVAKQAEGDLERFKAFIESEGYATGAWRGTVNAGAGISTPGASDAASSVGDDGKDGISLKTAAAGIGVVAAAAAVAAAVTKGGEDSPDTTSTTPAQSMPAQSMPAQSMPAQSMPVESMPVESIPVASMPVASMPVASMPVAPMPVETVDQDDAIEVVDITEQERMRTERNS